ncbi:ABC-type cobalamin/Fe3+-siderophores transport system ATPase subunit [Paenarthrobacter nicotinovorans]|uniref:ATP-dependent nuclease n=1 Tax=Paenarthrobacter nicotinovorans TaxID=29320 RepID=UPI0027889C1E|nr:AAA family ATPase [Paenarthrobacter nicotinovorans]MDP9936864.1 ABC-type cobalamin/Fe3+-siderophores transport system ATPase subunit [Paenarthrobacter nicotinovorans]
MTQDWTERLKAAFPDQAHLVNGKAENFDIAIDRINLFGGQSIPLQRAGVTAIVGANNAGKSTVLREVSEKLSHIPGYHEQPRVAVDSLDLYAQGNENDVISWLGQNANFVFRESSAGFHLGGNILPPSSLVMTWHSPPTELGHLASSLIFYGNAQGRFALGSVAEMRDVGDPPQHPVHYLQDSKPLFDEVSSVSREVFGLPLTLDTLGRVVRLRVGEMGMEAPRINEIPVEYRDRMASLRPLDDQGDGMRSLLGQLLPIVTAAYRVVILDEPEAFLHPPQAHALGAQLGRLATKTGIQILIATHDRSFITGLLDSGVDVSVVRLSRSEGTPKASQLDAGQLRALWTDPVLKYTNVLDGLFHRLVVLAEAEGDCAYLAAAVDCDDRTEGPLPRNEILFIPTGGKDGMAKVAAALTAVDVPVVAAPDLDMLSDQKKLQTLVEAVGGNWTDDMAKLWRLATVDLNARREPAKVSHVLDAIVATLNGKRDAQFSPEDKEAVLAQLRTQGSPWAAVKDHGMSAFKGSARKAAGALLELLEDAGVVLVREGELERLAPEIEARKGPGWLQASLAEGQQCNQTTQAHVDRILSAGAAKLERQRPESE